MILCAEAIAQRHNPRVRVNREPAPAFVRSVIGARHRYTPNFSRPLLRVARTWNNDGRGSQAEHALTKLRIHITLIPTNNAHCCLGSARIKNYLPYEFALFCGIAQTAPGGHMYQRLVLVGNLGRDPELHYSTDGVPIANFSVATHSKWSDNEGQVQEETVWFRVSAFGKLAEVCQEFLTKGQKVLIEGSLTADPKNGSPRVFTRKDGSTGSAFEVRATTVRFLTGKGEKQNGNGAHDTMEAEQEPLFA